MLGSINIGYWNFFCFHDTSICRTKLHENNMESKGASREILEELECCRKKFVYPHLLPYKKNMEIIESAIEVYGNMQAMKRP